MNKRALVLVALAACLMIAVAPAFADMGKHDMIGTSTGFKGTADEICIFCHTPHNGTQQAVAPLWNRTLPTNGSYLVYGGSGGFSGTTLAETAVGQPGNASLICLSCHDGTVAVDAFGGSSGTAGATMDSGDSPAFIGLDLQNDHPIGVVMTPGSSGFKAIQAKAKLFTGSKVECGSCHDVHTPGASLNFLRVENTGSALCLDCHDK